MRLDRLISLGLVRPLRQLIARENGARLPVLMYHSVSDDPEPSLSDYHKVCVSPARFAEQMRWLAEQRWRGVSLSEGLAALAGEARLPVPSRTRPDATPSSSSACLVALTFDDGFRDFHSAAAPILKEFGFSATMYLPTAFVGDERRSFNGRECLSWAEVRELAAAGIEFGSHTVNHRKLVTLDWPEIETELRESRAEVEDQIHSPVRSFAYPYAFPSAHREFTARLRDHLGAAGYETCVTTEIGTVRREDDRLRLPRLPINGRDDHALFLAKLQGSYDWMAGPQLLAKRLKKSRPA